MVTVWIDCPSTRLLCGERVGASPGVLGLTDASAFLTLAPGCEDEEIATYPASSTTRVFPGYIDHRGWDPVNGGTLITMDFTTLENQFFLTDPGLYTVCYCASPMGDDGLGCETGYLVPLDKLWIRGPARNMDLHVSTGLLFPMEFQGHNLYDTDYVQLQQLGQTCSEIDITDKNPNNPATKHHVLEKCPKFAGFSRSATPDSMPSGCPRRRAKQCRGPRFTR